MCLCPSNYTVELRLIEAFRSKGFLSIIIQSELPLLTISNMVKALLRLAVCSMLFSLAFSESLMSSIRKRFTLRRSSSSYEKCVNNMPPGWENCFGSDAQCVCNQRKEDQECVCTDLCEKKSSSVLEAFGVWALNTVTNVFAGSDCTATDTEHLAQGSILNETDALAAIASVIVYRSKSSYAESIPGTDYNKVDEYATPNEVVYYSETNNAYIYAIMGTQGAKDALTDTEILDGQLHTTKRYTDTEDLYTKFRNQIASSGARVVLTGHSLGKNLICSIDSLLAGMLTSSSFSF